MFAVANVAVNPGSGIITLIVPFHIQDLEALQAIALNPEVSMGLRALPYPSLLVEASAQYPAVPIIRGQQREQNHLHTASINVQASLRSFLVLGLAFGRLIELLPFLFSESCYDTRVRSTAKAPWKRRVALRAARANRSKHLKAM